MKSKLILLTCLTIGSMAAYSQTTPSSTKTNLEKAKANPKTKEQQAKADVHVVKKTPVIADTASIKQAEPTPAAFPAKKKKAKKA